MAYVYRHIRLDKNEPFYIGIGSDENYNRAYNKSNRNKIWKSIVERTNYEIEIMLDNLTIEESRIKEIEFINLYKKIIDKGILSNLSSGGESNKGYKRSIEAINKTALSNKGRILSEESKKIISSKLKGRKLLPETIEKMRVRMLKNTNTLGSKLSNEHKAKLSLVHKGVKQKIVKCPYCIIKGGISAMKKWHFNNCKNK